MRPLPAYDHINGWIASEALDGLRDVVEKALEGMLGDLGPTSTQYKQKAAAGLGAMGITPTKPTLGGIHEVADEDEPGRGRVEALHELPVGPRKPDPRQGARDQEQNRRDRSAQTRHDHHDRGHW